MVINLAIDPNRVPDVYETRLVGREDYYNPEQGGLSFSRGDTVYLLLRNQDGWLVIHFYKMCMLLWKIDNKNLIICDTSFLSKLFRCTGMANGVIGTFAESEVYEYGMLQNYN